MFAIRLGPRTADNVIDHHTGRWVVDYDPAIDKVTQTYGLTLAYAADGARKFPTAAAALDYANQPAPGCSPLRVNYNLRIVEV